MSNYSELKERAWEANRELPNRGLCIYTFGNASAFDKERGVFAIKPSGVAYEKLRPEQMVVVDLGCSVVEGTLRYSSDTKTHAVLYRQFAGIGGLVHTHSPYCVAWAQAMKPIPIFGTTHADHCQVAIPCTNIMPDDKIRGDYEEETGNLICEAFKNLSYKEVEMVLVACHGPFTWGVSVEKAVYNSVVAEELAKMALLTVAIDATALPLKQTLIDKHYERKHGKNAYYGQL
jgi:L-ribulose-5-phosphate 4-epimerase